MFHGLRPALLAILLVWVGVAALAQAVDPRPQPRLALVIGNANYAAAPLATAGNDAALVATTLATQGFDVTAAADVDTATWRKLLTAFAGKVQAAGPQSLVAVYLSGYGLQVDGANYLIPVEARIARDVDVAGAALPLADLARALDSAPTKARIFIYDLARDTPFAKAGAPLASGLSLVESMPNSLIAFNTAPGTVASVDVATYGIYARTLCEMLGIPGLPTAVLFDWLRVRVAQITDGAMIPWDDSTLDAGSTLVPSAAARPRTTAHLADRAIAGLSSDVAFFLAVADDKLAGYVDDLAAFPGDPLSARVETIVAARREALTWSAAIAADKANAYWTYMQRYPRGPHVLDARRRLALLHAALEPPPRFEVWDFGSLNPPAPNESVILGRHPILLDDPDWAPLPPLPDGLVPPSPRDEIDLSVPPLALAGALPLPMPTGGIDPGGLGTIVQPFVPGYGEVITRLSAGAGTTTMETTIGGARLSLTDARQEGKNLVVTQRDAQATIISRTITTLGVDVLSVQLGPSGGILRKVVTRTDSSGAHTMILSNGRNQLIATLDRDKNGVVTDMRRGAVPVRDETILFEPTLGAKLGSKVETQSAIAPNPPAPPAAPPAGPLHSPGALDGIPPPPPELKVEAPPPPPASSTGPAAPGTPILAAPSASAAPATVAPHDDALATPPLPPPRPKVETQPPPASGARRPVRRPAPAAKRNRAAPRKPRRER